MICRSVVRCILALIMVFALIGCQHRLGGIDPALVDNPQDPGVLNGTLKNGLTYYLRSANSSEQKRKIEVRLVVRVGSIHEESAEQGYAHLLEHLVFRGTKNFSAAQIESLLEEAGLRWGRDINATTHYGATIYRFSLTETEADLLPEVMALAADFMQAVNFDLEDLEREKKIVEAEWRFRYGHRNFVVDPLVNAALIGDKYKTRPPVGNLATVRSATADALEKFWQRHYRAANAALIVTGNIVPWELEKLVYKKFNDLPEQAVLTPSENREEFRAIKGRVQVEHISYVNPDLVSPQVSLNFISRVRQTGTLESLTESFREHLFFKAAGHFLTSRMAATSRCSATSLHSTLLETGQSVNGLEIDVADSDYLTCLQGLSVASQQMFRNGLTAIEYARLQNSFRSIAIESADQYRNSSPEDLAALLTQLVVYETPVLSAALLETVYLEMIDSISVSDFNRALAEIPAKYKVVYSASGPTDLALPKRELMALATQSAENEKFVAIAPTNQILHGVLNPDQLFDNLVGVGAEVESLDPIVRKDNYHEWELSNGARVIFHKDDRFDYVALAAVAPGGYLLADKKYSKAARMLPRFAGVNGAGGYLQKSLRRLQTEKSLYSELQVNPTHHGIFAYSVSDDVDLLLELTSAYFDEPVIVEPASSNLLRKLNARHQDNDLLSNFWQRFSGADDVTLETSHMRQVQNLLFRTPADFTFVIVGNVDSDILARELTRLERHKEKSLSNQEGYHALPASIKTTQSATEFRQEDERQRMNVSLFHVCEVPMAQRVGANLNLQLLSDIIERRLRFDIRENRGLSYQLETQLLTDNTGDGRRYHQIEYSVRSQDSLQAQILVTSVLNAIGRSGVTEQELQFALKREQKRRRDLSYDYLSSATEMAYAVQNGASVKDRSIEHVSLNQVNSIAACFSSDNTTFMVQDKILLMPPVLSHD